MFWNEQWNRDIDFFYAFRNSCVWYFRQVIDEIGPDMMQKELENLNMEIAIFLIGQVS
ncbi:MAG TPA: hypothetical protein H9980_08225 [Candidatus Erysipelatoclostridium merdavium]|uniref:Penicillin-binding protein transpeptidase domain-containing protein n=1 Tax=Candidatus Erysipelatoclostridium merdavium TaxID=2838566 RepID=A0A9D1XM88_9FIRM|nr:hypothetical protein [Candidatus Erysipelatoclostridium merdavium]